jgi:exodeoxyribonuclease VII large subunit
MTSPPDLFAREQREVFSPSALVRMARDVLEDAFPLIWVEGEVSNLSRPGSGHLYFCLKDAQAQVRCAMFRSRGILLRFKPADGQRVLARARLSLYEARGEFQLIVEHLEPTGEGALLRAFEQLKTRLAAEGLFAASLKRTLPKLARRIGVITSPTGAAVRDVLSVVRRRFPLAELEILPVPVQGREAPAAIIRALQAASQARRHDVILLTRGGGSLEDLWAFNDEALARAIRASAIPVVSAVGHEIDFTIADFAADLRAPTPSAAAELLVPDATELSRALRHHRERLRQHMRHRLLAAAQRADHARVRLARQQPRTRLRAGGERLAQLHARLHRQHPMLLLQRGRNELRVTVRSLRVGLAHRLEAHALQLGELARALNAVSPLATLQRGYAILREAETGRLLRSIGEVSEGKRLFARVVDGEFTARVESKPVRKDAS